MKDPFASLVLVVEDEAAIAEMLTCALRMEGYRVDTCSDGDAALEKIETEVPDIVILDVMLPGLDGFEVCRRMRNIKVCARIPVILLTARRSDADAIAGLELGANDYVKKPFSTPELMARVRAHLRTAGTTVLEYRTGPFMVDATAHEIRMGGCKLDLSPVEYKLLDTLLRDGGRTVSRDELLSRVWGYSDGDTRTVDVHIHRLRKKIEGAECRILTLRGRGFRLEFGPGKNEEKEHTEHDREEI